MANKEIGQSFFLKPAGAPAYRPATLEEFVSAERAAGFAPKGLTPADDDYWSIAATDFFQDPATGICGRSEL